MDFSLFSHSDEIDKSKSSSVNKSKRKKSEGSKSSHFTSPRTQSAKSVNSSSPGTAPSILSPRQLSEVNAFHLQKINEYKQALQECLNSSVFTNNNKSAYLESKREKLKIFNHKGDQKRQEIQEKKHQEEIKTLNQSKSMKLRNLQFRAATSKAKFAKKEYLKQKIEISKQINEKKLKDKSAKVILIENIKNYYSNKINQLQEKIMQEKTCNNLIRFEQQKILSDLIKKSKIVKKAKKNV